MENQPVQTVQEPVNKGGRPPVIDPGVEQLLIGAFQNGFNVTKACEYAGIARRTYYYYTQNDPGFLRKMTVAQNNLLVLAGNKIADILASGDNRDAGPLAKWLYEKKMPLEYGNQQAGPNNNQQNNFFLLNNEQLGNITKQFGLDESDPVKFVKEVEEASDLELRAEESGTVGIHSDQLQGTDTQG